MKQKSIFCVFQNARWNEKKYAPKIIQNILKNDYIFLFRMYHRSVLSPRPRTCLPRKIGGNLVCKFHWRKKHWVQSKGVKEKKTNIRKEREKLQFFLQIALKRKAWNGQNEQKGSNLKIREKKKIVNKKKRKKVEKNLPLFSHAFKNACWCACFEIACLNWRKKIKTPMWTL